MTIHWGHRVAAPHEKCASLGIHYEGWYYQVAGSYVIMARAGSSAEQWWLASDKVLKMIARLRILN